MAEVKNSFLASKMNKDLDDRLIPSNEYKDALNIAVSNSEDSDVGALENILQNTNVFPISSGTNVGYDTGKIIGYATDSSSDSVYLFWTNYTDTSANKLDYHQSERTGFNSAIIKYNAINSSFTKLLVFGTFLNFSTTHPIYGANIVEDLLFFTDNRNQPRKINVRTAAINPAGAVGNLGLVGIGSGYSAGIYNTTNQTGVGGSGLTVSISVNSYGFITSAQTVNPGAGYKIGDLVNVSGPGSGVQGILKVLSTSDYYRTEDDISVAKYAPYKPIDLYKDYSGTYKTTMKDVSSALLPDGTTNPDYNASYAGDKNFLEDKFVRFSYRFKYDDGEYSIMAPFTQIAFIPKQDGSFLAGDETRAYQSTVVSFMENKVDQISLVINLPDNGNDLENNYKIKELDILYKKSDGISISVLDTVSVNEIKNKAASSDVYEYSYQSRKPIKTLPQSQSTRVYDKTPVRALAQEVSGNRVIYGNYINKHTAPDHLNYEVTVTQKFSDGGSDNNWSYIEYPEHTIKRNRNYQVGFVLSDRYGRQSDVILSNVTGNDSPGGGFGDSSFYVPYRASATDPTTVLADVGNSIKIQLNEKIESIKSSLTSSSLSATGEPGLYDAATNPTGWYSYKVVVKQNQQEYYNVYLPGFLEGDLNNAPSSITHSVLISDNINKVPRDLQEVGPLQNKYSSDEVIFPVVENYHTNNSNWNQAFYPVIKMYEVTTIASFEYLHDLGGTAHGAIFENTEDPLIMRIGNNEGGLGATSQHMEPTLSIAETSPFVSNLDIYYETSASGLISDLNTSVDENLGTPVSGINLFDYNHKENQNPSGSSTVTGASESPFITSKFSPINNLNNVLTNTEFVGSLRVIDGLGSDRSDNFEIVSLIDSGNDVYRLKILNSFYYGINASSKESYTFEMGFRNNEDDTTADVNGAITTPSTLFTVDNVGTTPILVGQTVYNGNTLLGTVVNVDATGLIVTLDTAVTLADNLTLTFKAIIRTITKRNVSLSNIAPSISSIVYTQPSYSTMEGVYATINAVNGTFDTTKNHLDLSYSWDTDQSLFPGGNSNVSFANVGTDKRITLNNPNGGSVTLSLSENGVVSVHSGSFDFLYTFSLKANVTDAGAESTPITINFNDVIPGAFTNAFSTAFDI
jgi:hypothetical protein